ncbi:MAG: aspartate aminotransferase family protein, partial [Dehalococcoidia bacterium]
FMHAYTNSAHPTASAVGLRNLQIFEDEGLLANAQAMGDRLGEGLKANLGRHPHVTNLRWLALIAGFTLVRDAATNTPYDASETVAIKVQRHMREEGSLITRVVGDNVLFAPPLSVNAAEVDQIVASATAAVRAVTGA